MFRVPQLYTSESSAERHATWLELFFDLVFVVAVAELSHLLHEDLTFSGIAIFAALFVPVWWQWIDFSYYADQFDTDNVLSNLVTLVVMFGVLIMALTIREVTHGGSALFAAAYIALRVIIIALYLWAWRNVPESRELAGRYSTSFIIALMIWCISLLVPEPMRFVLWGLALLVEIGNGPLTYATIKQVPTQVSHMDERFGLFVIIVLGESVIAVATGVADTEWHAAELLTAACGFLIAALAWWLYFARADSSVINQALHSNRRGLLRSFVYGYSHLLIFAGITAAGVGIAVAIPSDAEHPFTLAGRVALGGGLGAFLLGVGIVQWATPRSLPAPILAIRMIGAFACIGLSFVSNLSPLALSVLLMVVLASQIAFEAVFSNRAPAEREPVGTS